MTSSTTLTMIDGVRVVVPDSLNGITPYVLREQLDWFEDEIKFLRRLLKPGQQVIDIGANYGVYTLSMAKSVGPAGQVWAFEPASGTAALLAEGIDSNDFRQVTLEQSALSNTCGTAQLSLNENSELNALLHGAPAAIASETVPLVSLDSCIERHQWRDIDFVKIDAEGEEENIISGGKRFFEELSPLVQYEIKAGDKLNMRLMQDFAAIGYDSYRLVPGLDLLVPFDSASTPDAYLLNLFCCKRDRAERLAADGFLLDSTTFHRTKGKGALAGVSEKTNSHDAYHWRNTLARLAYGSQLASAWDTTMAASKQNGLNESLALFVMSRDTSLSTVERFGALDAAFHRMKTLCERQASHLRLASLARVARAYGSRAIAVNALGQLANTVLRQKRVNLDEPFLAPCEHFDLIPPAVKQVRNWILAAVLEELELLCAFSSFYTGTSALQRLELIQNLGYSSDEMKRRLHLVQTRFGPPAS
jgi:protein O-GlcNAc transferase